MAKTAVAKKVTKKLVSADAPVAKAEAPAKKVITPNYGVPPIKAVHPTGNLILLERINEHELIQVQSLMVVDSGKPTNQAYILELGPMVAESYGFKAGQRVMLGGSLHVVPKGTHDDREKVVVLPDMIKAILEE